MKRLFASLSLFAIAFSGKSDAHCCCPLDHSFYLKVDTGISFSQSAQVVAPSPPWNAAIEGYNSALGNCAIAGLGIGWEYRHLVDVEVSFSNRSTFEYRKIQTTDLGGESYTREFDLAVRPLLFSVNLLGGNLPCLNWNTCCGRIYPLIGAGVGVSNLLITNFRTTGLPPTGASDPFASFSAENQYTRRNQFTYTALVGFEYNRHDTWAIATGYRWLDAGRFKGPRFLRVDTGAAVDVAEDAWQMRFRSHEWFVELKIYL